MKFGVTNCITKIRDETDREVVVIGLGNGINCFAIDGSPLLMKDDLGSSFTSGPPITWQNDLLFVSGAGSVHRLSPRNLKFESLKCEGFSATATSPAALMNSPAPIIIRGTKCLGDVVRRYYRYDLTAIPMFEHKTGQPTIFGIGRTPSDERADLNLGRVLFKPTIVTDGTSHFALIVTDRGNVFSFRDNKLNYSPLIDLKSTPCSPVIQLAADRFCIFTFDLDDSCYIKVEFTSNGELISKNTVQDKTGTAVLAKPASEPLAFANTKGKTNILQGFSDRLLRLIDVSSGRV